MYHQTTTETLKTGYFNEVDHGNALPILYTILYYPIFPNFIVNLPDFSPISMLFFLILSELDN